MKQYVVFDNVSGGYTIRYRYYNNQQKRYIYNVYQANDLRSMREFEKKLIKDNYKFVGSF